jgi:hypothetical protein
MTHWGCRPLWGGYYKLHKPLLGIVAVFKVHNHNPQKDRIPILMYNPWSTKTIWISQITTGSSLKAGRAFKVLIYAKPAVLRIWNVWKTRQLFVKIKFATDTDIGRHERHAGARERGNEIMGASWASHLYTREICGCVEKAAVGGHSTQRIFTCTKLLGINCDPTHYWRSPY